MSAHKIDVNYTIGMLLSWLKPNYAPNEDTNWPNLFDNDTFSKTIMYDEEK